MKKFVRTASLSALILICTAALPLAAQPAEQSAPLLDIQIVESPGGITAWLSEDHTLPIIALRLAFRDAGAALDPEEKQGLSLLASNMMDEGAGEYDSQQFQKLLTDHSISLRFSSGRDHFTGSLTTLGHHADLAFDLLRLALTAPRFDEEPLGRMRASNIARIRSSLAQPNWIAARIMNDLAFDGHPYALNSGGTLSTLPQITTADLHELTQQRLTRDRLIVSVAGAITPEELAARLDQVFAPLPETGIREQVPDHSVQNAGTVALYEMDIPQTIIQINQDGIARADPDFHAAQAMNFILGSSGFGSRLTEEVRERRGLTYGIYSSLGTMNHAPTLGVSTATNNESVAEVLGLIRAEWEKMAAEPVSAQELEDAKAYLIGSVPLGLASTGQIAGMMLGLQLDDLPPDYLDHREAALNALDADDLHRVARRLLDPEDWVTVLVGRPQAITPTVTITTLPHVE